jgi:glucose-6-phosphate isomerase
VQQLRDGLHNFFAVFVRVLRDLDGQATSSSAGPGQVEVEPQVSSGDCLDGFYQGTRAALAERGRASATIVLPAVDATAIGALIALFERAVGFYATLVNINAYHQPGVEAGKKAAAGVLALQRKVAAALGPEPREAEAIAAAAGAPDEAETVHHLLQHLAANGRARQEGEGASARFGRP